MSPHLIALFFLLAPQAPPIHVTINVNIDNLFIGEAPTGEAAPAVVETDCPALMESFNAAADQADPFERTASEFGLGDGCAVQALVPTQ